MRLMAVQADRALTCSSQVEPAEGSASWAASQRQVLFLGLGDGHLIRVHRDAVPQLFKQGQAFGDAEPVEAE